MLASAALSAVVSASVALALTSYRAARDAAAARRVAARTEIRTRANVLRDTLRRYRAGFAGSQRREPNVAESEDYVTASGFISPASDLGPVRRRLVTRRCRKIFGDHWTALAIIGPADPANVDTHFLLPFWNMLNQRVSHDPTAGLIHQAYSRPPGDRLLRRLARQVDLLSRSI